MTGARLAVASYAGVAEGSVYLDASAREMGIGKEPLNALIARRDNCGYRRRWCCGKEEALTTTRRAPLWVTGLALPNSLTSEHESQRQLRTARRLDLTTNEGTVRPLREVRAEELISACQEALDRATVGDVVHVDRGLQPA